MECGESVQLLNVKLVVHHVTITYLLTYLLHGAESLLRS